MNTFKKIFFVSTILLSILNTACHVEDKLEDKLLGCNGYDQDLTELSTQVNEAQQAYAEDSTPATCSAYVDALYAYADGVEDVWDCVPKLLRKDYESTLDAYDAIIAETEEDCDDL